MDIKVTFKIETTMSDEKIKQSLINNFIWGSDHADDISVWSPISILPSYIIPASNLKAAHTTFIDIEYNPDYVDFDALYNYIYENFDCSVTPFKKPNPDKYKCDWVPTSSLFDPFRETKKESEKDDLYCISIEHVNAGLTLKKIEELISEKLTEEYETFSSIFENAPLFSNVDAFSNGKDGVCVYIKAPYKFFEWFSFTELRDFIKEKIEKPDYKAPLLKYELVENSKEYEVHFKTDCKEAYESISNSILDLGERFHIQSNNKKIVKFCCPYCTCTFKAPYADCRECENNKYLVLHSCPVCGKDCGSYIGEESD